MVISSINALIEALRDGQAVSRVWISQERQGKKIDLIKELCRQRGVVYQFIPPAALQRKAGGPHQGVCAEIASVRFYTLQNILAEARGGLLLMLDGIEDTGNLGAIMRTAAAAAVDGVILPARKSAPVNETVWKTSAGAVGKLRIAVVTNLANALDQVKKAGFWVVASDARASLTCYEHDFRPATALILGGEQRGVSPLLQKKSDVLVTIPHASAVESLNVAAAAAVLLFEVRRQRLSPG